VLLTKIDRELPTATIFSVEGLAHLKICGSQANLQQLHDSFNLQQGLLRQRITVVDLTSDDLQGIVDWHIRQKINNVEANDGTKRLKVDRLQQLYEVVQIFHEEFRFFNMRNQ
jgi:hypothetical protein